MFDVQYSIFNSREDKNLDNMEKERVYIMRKRLYNVVLMRAAFERAKRIIT